MYVHVLPSLVQELEKTKQAMERQTQEHRAEMTDLLAENDDYKKQLSLLEAQVADVQSLRDELNELKTKPSEVCLPLLLLLFCLPSLPFAVL